jgi:di/tricarboxylate transporter
MIDVYLIALTLGAVLLLTFERASMTTVGVGLLLAVSIPGLLSVDRTAQSLAVPPILTVAALCVVGEGLSRTGVASLLARRLLRNGSSSEAIVVLKLCVVAALASAFVNNTLVVVAFLPVVTTISRTTGIFPSRMLIPLSYASILGGVCTLVGTSTNLLVSGSMERLGLAPIGMFELTPIGVVLTAIGIAYLVTLGRISLPKVPSLTAQAGAQETAEYVTEIRIVKDSPRIGQPVSSVVGDGPDDRARRHADSRRGGDRSAAARLRLRGRRSRRRSRSGA